MEPSKVGRRRFLKYVGTGLVAATAAGAGYYLYSSQRGPPTTQTTTTTQTPIVWKPPAISEIQVKPRYINPTPADKVEFSYLCFDTGNNPLSNTWLIDGKETSNERKYSTKLSEGDHSIVLKVSDGRSEATKYGTVMVDPDQIYPSRQLHIKLKGVCYCAGPVAPEWSSLPNPSREEMDEQLDTIRHELGCNAIVIFAGGDHEDELIECGRLAIEKGFDRIYIGPEYMAASPEETVERLGKLAPRVRDLRETSESIVFLVGHEFGLETAIVRGDTWDQRAVNLSNGEGWDRIRAIVPKMFRDIIAICKKNYGHKISYRAIPYEEVDLVPWQDPIFESVGVDAYVSEIYGQSEDWVFGLLSRLKMYRKSVHCTETGCMTFSGAGYLGGASQNAGVTAISRPYDEDEQANYIDRYCKTLNRARIDGYFYTLYNEHWDKGYGLYNGKKRKKGFYMYKSYKPTG